jgi:hypothetical protein
MPRDPELNVSAKVSLRELPPDVVSARVEAVKDDAANEPIVRPRMEGTLSTCRLVLDKLVELHRRVVDVTDLDPEAKTRDAALWLVSGRCVGLLDTLLVQVAAGVCTEAMATGRTLWEAMNMLIVFGDPGEEELLNIWLADEGKYDYVKPGAAREAHAAFEEKIDAAIERAGLPRTGPTKELNAEIYDRLSRTAHNRRSSCLDSYWARGRQMAYGRHPSPLRRAAYASWAATMTDSTAGAVGDALGAFYADGFFAAEIKPLVRDLDAIRQTMPLDSRSIREAAGTE